MHVIPGKPRDLIGETQVERRGAFCIRDVDTLNPCEVSIYVSTGVDTRYWLNCPPQFGRGSFLSADFLFVPFLLTSSFLRGELY